MTTKADLVRQRLDDAEGRFGPVARLAALVAGTAHQLPGALYHGRIATVDRAVQVRAYMAEYGNTPPGMSLCDVAGINGDAADGCPFAGTDDCTCDQ